MPASSAACASLLRYNAKFVARIVSSGCALQTAQHQLLNIAALHALEPAEPSLALASSMEVLPVSAGLLSQIQAASGSSMSKATGRVSLVTSDAASVKMPVFAVELGAELRDQLASEGLCIKHKQVYCTYNMHNMPILTGVVCAQNNAISLTTLNQTRRWLAAACSAHPALAPLLPLMSSQAAINFNSAIGTPASSALDCWFALAHD